MSRSSIHRRRVLQLLAATIVGAPAAAWAATGSPAPRRGGRGARVQAGETEGAPQWRVRVGTAALGGLVHGVVGDAFAIAGDAGLGPLELAVDRGDTRGAAIALTLKQGASTSAAAAARVLDDARHAPSLTVKIREAITQALRSGAPGEAGSDGLVAEIAARQPAYARELAKAVLTWTKRLKAAKLEGARVRDEYGRTHLLRWAGAVIDDAGAASPRGLASAPADAAAATATAYAAYVEALVAAVVAGG